MCLLTDCGAGLKRGEDRPCLIKLTTPGAHLQRSDRMTPVGGSAPRALTPRSGTGGGLTRLELAPTLLDPVIPTVTAHLGHRLRRGREALTALLDVALVAMDTRMLERTPRLEQAHSAQDRDLFGLLDQHTRVVVSLLESVRVCQLQNGGDEMVLLVDLPQ